MGQSQGKKELNKFGFSKMMVVRATRKKPETSFEVFYTGIRKGQPDTMKITAKSYAIANAIARNHAVGREYTIEEMKPARYENERKSDLKGENNETN